MKFRLLKEEYKGHPYYRGYDSRYGILDNKENTLYTWLTDDYAYAKEYASNNKFGKIALVELTCGINKIGSTYDLDEDVDYLEPGDEVFKEQILDKGLYGYDFYTSEDDYYCLCVAKSVCRVIDFDYKIVID